MRGDERKKKKKRDGQPIGLQKSKGFTGNNKKRGEKLGSPALNSCRQKLGKPTCGGTLGGTRKFPQLIFTPISPNPPYANHGERGNPVKRN